MTHLKNQVIRNEILNAQESVVWDSLEGRARQGLCAIASSQWQSRSSLFAGPQHPLGYLTPDVHVWLGGSDPLCWAVQESIA